MVDPCLFIRRFCDRLEFGNKLEEVVRLATRFLQSMDRAWISTGRRPNGLCGAAILIAARVLNFQRSTSQIVRVAHVCEETLRKRLTEFKQTRMAQLTRGELRKIDQRPLDSLKRSESEQSIEESMDPPSFTRKFLREELRISENELNKYQKILAEKALKITQKLKESDS